MLCTPDDSPHAPSVLAPSSASSSASAAVPAPAQRMMSFAGFQAYLCTVARLCRETEKYTDVRVECSDGVLHAHRLVLGSASPFLRALFLDHPPGLDVHLMIPTMRKAVVATLLEFLYTGKMVLARSHTHDLQQLVHILQIDPENVRIDTPSPDPKETKLVQAKITAIKGGVRVVPPAPPPPTTRSESSGGTSAALGSTETSGRPQRTTTKRKISNDPTPTADHALPKVKELKIILPHPNSLMQSLKKTSSNPATNNGKTLRRRSTRRRPAQAPPTSTDLPMDAKDTTLDSTPTGFHDMSNVHTWVCALCSQFDPVLPPGVESGPSSETEWVGCDCDRWYHKYCTHLPSIDDSFECSQVNLTCLPMKET
ncbi:hypothetical protein TCAL_02910 [Tigriopus californicus]|uniref:BTB domain-containing protein n=1 Tax=Tigriopus californicus TaxID=6832 RepID=A0A553NP42_TIGCA|nr:uncharacterized protein LOC131879647 [Tigriopus californicus]TRY67209.1 hypothetical protein TCAL_02910 [Tigriopus californicus]|eukprot:TCALIF_02910-PA protein Name:"Similar to ab Protein abrupt (Drosophila melanogaster)" AED:0.00 eAED:0.00 QI:267/1/1/1/1/1/3/127/368